MKILVTGMAGTGKSSVAEVLKQKGIKAIDLDYVPDLCSWVDPKSKQKVLNRNPDKEFMEKHDYRCDTDKLKEILSDSKELTIIFGAVADNSQLIPLVDNIFLLQVSPDVMIERIVNRKTNEFGKDESVHAGLIEWKGRFEKMMIDQGAIVIDAEQRLNDVVVELLYHIQSDTIKA